MVERQRQRQQHLAAACKRLGLGQQTPNFKTSDMYINDTLKYVYCVVNKVIRLPAECLRKAVITPPDSTQLDSTVVVVT